MMMEMSVMRLWLSGPRGEGTFIPTITFWIHSFIRLLQRFVYAWGTVKYPFVAVYRKDHYYEKACRRVCLGYIHGWLDWHYTYFHKQNL